MSEEIQTVEKRLANQVGKFTSEEIAIIKNTVAKGATDLELAYFLNVAASYNLSPFKREVWFIKGFNNQVLIFAGRDGHLAAAQRDPRWSGIASCEVRENDKFSLDIPNGKVNHKATWKDRGAIVGAYAICKPRGCDIATIEWVEMGAYNKGANTWKSDPAAMIKKVAETHCLKKAYGLSGLTSEYDFEVVGEKAYPKDIEEPPTIQKISYVEGLIRTSTYDHETQASMERGLVKMSHSELDELAENLRLNQLDQIHERGNYSQTDLKR